MKLFLLKTIIKQHAIFLLKIITKQAIARTRQIIYNFAFVKCHETELGRPQT